MFGWLRELYEIRHTNRERALYCEACDVLKVELAQERLEKQRLLNHILHPKAEEEPVISNDTQPIVPRHVPWRVKQQELETKDRAEAARIMKQFQNRAKGPVDTEKLEKDMGIG